MARSAACGNRALTQPVVTLWYRAPELLLGCPTYDVAVDMWSAGCIFAELILGTPLLPGSVEQEQLRLMVALLGTPSQRIWPGIVKCAPECLAALEALRPQPYNNLLNRVTTLTNMGYEFLNAMLTYDPERRITAARALRHPFFREVPAPADKTMMPTFSDTHMK